MNELMLVDASDAVINTSLFHDCSLDMYFFIIFFSVLENKNTLNCNQPTRQAHYTSEINRNAIKNSLCIFMLTLILVPLLFLLLSDSNIKDLLKHVW